MRINTNVSALNTLRNLANSDQAVASATAKLSSGFRINKAMDDAAGLAIANKLRNTGRALGAAQKNVEQGIAMLQIADGSLQSIAGILDRMKELATQHDSANTGADAQTNIEAEFDVLTDGNQPYRRRGAVPGFHHFRCAGLPRGRHRRRRERCHHRDLSAAADIDGTDASM